MIRRYRPADEPALYQICLRTGDDGADAARMYTDPRLLGHVYVGPYLALEPHLAFVLEGEGADGAGAVPLGYVLGAADTASFAARCEASWWPPLRERYPDPAGLPAGRRTADQRLAALIHHPPVAPEQVTAPYPSHLHIDLLPAASGRGHGRALLDRLLAALAAAGSTGVHLGVSAGNQRAIAFYRRRGFVEIDRHPGGLLMGRPLC